MKKTFSLLLAGSLLLTLAQPLQAAQQFDTYQAAQKRVTDEGYILFIYPAGWDKYGEKLCKKLLRLPGTVEQTVITVVRRAPHLFRKRHIKHIRHKIELLCVRLSAREVKL